MIAPAILTSITDLMNLTEGVGPRWKTFGLHLGIANSRLEEIQLHTSDDSEQCREEVLKVGAVRSLVGEGIIKRLVTG